MAESAVVGFLRLNGFLQAERRSLKGSLDQGDVTGTPGLCWEVKYADGGIRMGAWMAQTEIERLNSDSEFGILVIKPRGLGVRSVGRWYAVMSSAGHDRLLEMAEKNGGEDFGWVIATTITYTAGAMALALVQARNDPAILGHGLIPAITVVPPGAVGQPLLHYRVMHLDMMIQLLRAAGYGDPL